MRQSNKLCVELLPTYTDFEEFNGNEFVGYKLAMKKGDNHYSIVTGLFRYKAGTIGPSSYSGLYKKEVKHYNEHLQDRVAIFTNKEDALKALCLYNELENENCDLAILEIRLKNGLERAKYNNKFVSNLDVVVGRTMDKITEVEVLKAEEYDTRAKSVTLR